MEEQVEKILVHDGVQILTQSAWTATYNVETKLFVLVGLREKEILSAMQTTEKDLIKDIENFNLFYPWNSKIIGLYIQYTGTKPANHLDILENTLQNALHHKLLLLSNFFYILADQKTVIGTGVSFDSILQSYEYSLIQYGQNSSRDRNQWWDNRKLIRAEFEVSDLKRDYVVNNFFYIQIRQIFEGFDDELSKQQEQFLDHLENPRSLIMIFKQLGNEGLVQPYQSMGEDFGKRLNIEARKLIKANKDKQQSYNLVKLELMTLPSENQSTRCPSYQLFHKEKEDLRKMDISLIGIFTTSDNLHDQLDLFMKHCKKHLQTVIYPQTKANNVQLLQYNLRESALLQNTFYKFGRSQFYDSAAQSPQFLEQRLKYITNYCYQMSSPRLMVQNSIQSVGEVVYDRPLLIHSSLMKKLNFDTTSHKYCVSGDYLYYHYMQDGFNDNGWGCAYRSLQTLISHFKYEGYASRTDVPSHKEIQQALVSMEDKEKDMIGSSQWIGAFEVNLCMDYFLKAECKIMNVSSGLELQTKGRELRDHFIHQGTPIMIGGDLYAHTIIGIDFCEEMDDLRFLILDPHYPGGDNNIKNILQKGWCAWKDVTMFKADSFYNLCMPLKPSDY